MSISLSCPVFFFLFNLFLGTSNFYFSESKDNDGCLSFQYRLFFVWSIFFQCHFNVCSFYLLCYEFEKVGELGFFKEVIKFSSIKSIAKFFNLSQFLQFLWGQPLGLSPFFIILFFSLIFGVLLWHFFDFLFLISISVFIYCFCFKESSNDIVGRFFKKMIFFHFFLNAVQS